MPDQGHPKPRGKVLRPEDTGTEGSSRAAQKARDEVANQQLEAQERNLTKLPPSPDESIELSGTSPSGREKKVAPTVERLPGGGWLIDTHGPLKLEGTEEILAAQRAFGRLGSNV